MSEEKRDIKEVIRISISRARPGMELARDIYSRNDQVILNAGVVLDAQKIAKIMFYSIDSIAVYKQADEGKQTLTEQIKNGVEFREFTKKYDMTVSLLKDSMDRAISGDGEFDEAQLIGEIERIVSESGSKKNIMGMLYCIKTYDEMTYMHCVNVSIICSCFAEWLGMSDEEKQVLILSGLLHDIGKTMVPKRILLKPDALTPEEYAIMKTHTTKGYEFLRKKKLDERVKLAALEHHERYDRTGYPDGKSGEEITPFAMITAIADVYDAMTSDRIYRPGLCPFEVLRVFEGEGMQRYDPRYLIPLLEQITEVYIHHTVRLSDDSVGEIIMLNRAELSKPVIRIGDNFIDLTKRRDLKIEEVL